MTDMLSAFLLSVLTSGQNLLPIVFVIVVFQYLVIRKQFVHNKKILSGLALVIIGITLFLKGLDMALFPLGKLMAKQLTSIEFVNASAKGVTWQAYSWAYIFAASIGFASTLAEPALLAVAAKAQHISGGTINSWGLRIAVSLGIAIGAALGVFRIITGFELFYLLITGYCIVIIQALFAPKVIIALAFDSGPVTTSTVTVPLITALGLGLADVVPGRSPLLDGFGLIALASLGSTISVLLYAQLAVLLSKTDNPTQF